MSLSQPSRTIVVEPVHAAMTAAAAPATPPADEPPRTPAPATPTPQAAVRA